MQQNHLAAPAATPIYSIPSSGSSTTEAPPKQVALAIDRLSQASRLIADIRIGADRLLEAVFLAEQPHQTSKPLQFLIKEDASMRQHLQDLRALGMWLLLKKSTLLPIFFIHDLGSLFQKLVVFLDPFLSNLHSHCYMIFILLGRQLEESGVLNESLRSRSNSWGLHMPLVCPDGAVVAYAWKRQLAGQAAASAVDRTRFVFSTQFLYQLCLVSIFLYY